MEQCGGSCSLTNSRQRHLNHTITPVRNALQQSDLLTAQEHPQMGKDVRKCNCESKQESHQDATRPRAVSWKEMTGKDPSCPTPSLQPPFQLLASQKFPVQLGHTQRGRRSWFAQTEEEEEEGWCLCLTLFYSWDAGQHHPAPSLLPPAQILTPNVKKNNGEIRKKPSDLTQLQYLF